MATMDRWNTEGYYVMESLVKHCTNGQNHYSNDSWGNREFKQITTAGATTAGATTAGATTAAATTAAVTEKVWGEYVSVVCQILSLAGKAKYKDKRNIR